MWSHCFLKWWKFFVIRSFAILSFGVTFSLSVLDIISLFKSIKKCDHWWRLKRISNRDLRSKFYQECFEVLAIYRIHRRSDTRNRLKLLLNDLQIITLNVSQLKWNHPLYQPTISSTSEIFSVDTLKPLLQIWFFSRREVLFIKTWLSTEAIAVCSLIILLAVKTIP